MRYDSRHGWFDGKRGVETKQRIADTGHRTDRDAVYGCESEKNKTLATKLFVLTYFMLHCFGKPGERDEVTSELIHDFVYPPQLHS